MPSDPPNGGSKKGVTSDPPGGGSKKGRFWALPGGSPGGSRGAPGGPRRAGGARAGGGKNAEIFWGYATPIAKKCNICPDWESY